jgi:hypothetical protein
LLLGSVPVTVTVKEPLGPRLPATNVRSSVTEPLEIVTGFKAQDAVTPLGSPETDRFTVSESGPLTVTVTLPLLFVLLLRDKVIVEELSDKLRAAGGGGVVTVTVAVQFTVPPSPVAVPV